LSEREVYSIRHTFEEADEFEVAKHWDRGLQSHAVHFEDES